MNTSSSSDSRGQDFTTAVCRLQTFGSNPPQSGVPTPAQTGPQVHGRKDRKEKGRKGEAGQARHPEAEQWQTRDTTVHVCKGECKGRMEQVVGNDGKPGKEDNGRIQMRQKMSR